MLTFVCPKCRATVRVPPALTGRLVACGACKSPSMAPTPVEKLQGVPRQQPPAAIPVTPTRPPRWPLVCAVASLAAGLVAMPVAAWLGIPPLGAALALLAMMLGVVACGASLVLKAPGGKLAGLAALVCLSAAVTGVQFSGRVPESRSESLAKAHAEPPDEDIDWSDLPPARIMSFEEYGEAMQVAAANADLAKKRKRQQQKGK